MKQLVKDLINSGYLKTPAIIDAFQKIDRIDFVPAELKEKAHANVPLPIGHGQTISQPLTVAFMLELLQPEPGNKILEIGSGSGWQTALLSHIIGDEGRVFAIELIPELESFGRKNVSQYNFVQKKIANFYCLNALNGLPGEAPFDRIISAASSQEIPLSWKEQLKIGGRMVVPVRDSVYLVIKKGENQFEGDVFPGFAFVPFVDK
jgi:protein-L-isoaspartate(D-aspartate) O-methyltransferase